MNRVLQILFHQARFVYLLLIFLLVLGIKAALEMPSAIYPPLSFPRVVVVADVGTRAPDQIVIQITRPLEEDISTVPGVKRIRSKTIRGSTELSVDFLDGTDMDKALALVQGRVSDARSNFPPDVNLTVERLTPGAFPVMAYNVSSKTLPLTDVQELVRYQILPNLRRVPGVSRVLFSGGDTREIDVEVDPQTLAQNQLTPTQLIDALQKGNQIGAVGRLQEHYQQALLIQNSTISSFEEMKNILITPATGLPVFLGTLADIHPGIQERTNLVSGRQGPCVSISILKQQNANMLSVSAAVQDAIRNLKPSLPRDITIRPVYDQADLVQASVRNVEEAILLGTILIFGVLLFFLNDWRTTVLAALTIPLTVILTFGVMAFANQDFNLMSLGGMAVAIGLVIDDAIVVIENIHRHHALTPTASWEEVIYRATGELVGPITSSTLTTIVVFFPLGLLFGVAGQFFQAFSFTLTVSVIISWLIALLVLPLLARQFLKTPVKPPQQRLGDHPSDGPLETVYARFLNHFFAASTWQILGLGALTILGGLAFLHLPTGFMPDMDEGSYVIDYFAPPGSSLQTTDAIAKQIERVLAQTPEVMDWSRRTGAELGFFATEQNRGDILVRLKPKANRQRAITQIIDEQRHAFSALMPRVDFDFMQILQDQLDDLAGAPAPVEVKLFGDQPEALSRLAKTMQEKLAQVPGLVDVKLGTQLSAPQITIKPNLPALSRIDLTPDDLQHQLETAFLGTVVSQARNGDRLINIRVRYPASIRDHLLATPIFANTGLPVPLGSLAHISHQYGPGEIQRENQQRDISIEGAPQGRDLGSIQRDVLQVIHHFKLPSGFHAEMGGLYESQQQAFRQLLSVLLLAILMVYGVMVFQFRSFQKPLLILLMIPLGLAGVSLILFLTRTPLNVASFMGMILLTGLIVKNGIILIAYADQLVHDQHMPVSLAVRQAGRIRLRPILMTTLATILGLFPLALGWGSGAELQKPLAIAVIGGLFFSTYMSLTALPWFYAQMARGADPTNRNP